MSYYDEHDPNYRISILDTEYSVWIDVPEDKDDMFTKCSGYCDKSSKRIVVVAETKDSELSNWENYSKCCLRHEIIHAYLHESGLNGNANWDDGNEHPEMVVDWVAWQFPKLLKTFKEVNAL